MQPWHHRKLHSMIYSRSRSRRLPIGVAQVLIAGALLDRLLKDSEQYANRAKAAGDSFRIVKLEGSNHFAMLSPHSSYWPTVRDAISSLLH